MVINPLSVAASGVRGTRLPLPLVPPVRVFVPSILKFNVAPLCMVRACCPVAPVMFAPCNVTVAVAFSVMTIRLSVVAPVNVMFAPFVTVNTLPAYVTFGGNASPSAQVPRFMVPSESGAIPARGSKPQFTGKSAWGLSVHSPRV